MHCREEICRITQRMLIQLIDRIRLPFRKDKELYSSLYHIIGIYPRNISYYKMALMHKSIMHRNKKGKPVNNERLEFLGDAILDAAVGDIVYRHFTGKREGFLTNTRSKLVQRDTLNKLAMEMGINNLILSNGQSATHNSYLGGNAFEALVGALYLDRGYDACMTFLKKRILSQMINIDKVAYKEVNFKSRLIEWSQKNKVKVDFDQIVQNRDKTGSPVFCCTIKIEGLEGCQGSGFSKKESQQKASRETLNKLKREPQFIDSVFEAKASRTKMEEEPVLDVPSTSEADDFVKNTGCQEVSMTKHKTAFREHVYSEQECADNGDDYNEKALEQPADEFDLSDISATAKSREEIIAAAEEAAFVNDNQ